MSTLQQFLIQLPIKFSSIIFAILQVPHLLLFPSLLASFVFFFDALLDEVFLEVIALGIEC
jgi:hypothetical protein